MDTVDVPHMIPGFGVLFDTAFIVIHVIWVGMFAW